MYKKKFKKHNTACFFGDEISSINKVCNKEVGKSKQDTQNFCKYSLCLFWLNSPQRVANPRANFKLGWGFSLMVNVFTLASFLCSC